MTLILKHRRTETWWRERAQPGHTGRRSMATQFRDLDTAERAVRRAGAPVDAYTTETIDAPIAPLAAMYTPRDLENPRG